MRPGVTVQPVERVAAARSLTTDGGANHGDQRPIASKVSSSLIELQLSGPRRVRLGEVVPVTVTLRNVTALPIWMVGVVAGAEGGHRLPRYLPRVVAEGRVVAAPSAARPAGPVAPLRLADFHRLDPGAAFDPTRSDGRSGWMPLQTFLQFRPRRRGSYVFVVTLSTAPGDADRWIDQLDPGDDEREMLDRVTTIPRVVVESNRLEVVAA